MLPLRYAFLVVLLVAAQGILLSKVLGGSILTRGSFLTRAFTLGIISITTFLFLNYFYRPRIKSLSKKAVLVTGCDTGFGHRIAKQLESRGFTTFACCLNPSSEDAQQLKTDSGRMHLLQMDVTSDEQVQAALKKVVDILRQENKYLWAIVNNAGIGHFGFAEMLPLAFYERQLSVNTMGLIRTTKAFLPLLRGHGRVVNLTSIGSRIYAPYHTGYCMSKAAALAFSDCLRLEMKSFNVKVITVEPLYYRTNLVNSSSVTKSFYKLWDTAPQYIRDQYGEEYYSEATKKMATVFDGGRSDIGEVSDATEEAVMSLTPKNHYIPHLYCQLYFKCLNALPESLRDKLLCDAYIPKYHKIRDKTSNTDET